MGDCNGCEGDTWLVDTLNRCQSLRGRALDGEPGKGSLKLLAFLFSLLSPSIPSPFPLILHFLLPFHSPFSPWWSGVTPRGRAQSHSWLWVQGVLSPRVSSLCPVKGAAPQGIASLLPHDIPRGPWTPQSASISLRALTAPKREQRAWSSQELKDGSPLGCDSLYAPCSLLG